MKNVSFNAENLSVKQQKLVADFVSVVEEMGLTDDYKTKGLIYFANKANLISHDEIAKNYPLALDCVNTLIKLDEINYSQQNAEAENLRKMFFAITKDFRIIMLKIAIVVAEIRNIDPSKAFDLANLVLTLYAPLAARLGLSNFKTELEETAFKILQPKAYANIEKEVDARFFKREPIVERLKKLVETSMADLNISGKVFGRKKHIYSIYKKLKDHTLDNIYDLIAVRAIVQTVAECYALLGRLHSQVEPLENRFKDYIATPKPNGYQSLHTTVIFEGFPVEIQIRTDEMNKYAEYGVAAHWIYKEKRKKQNNLDAELGMLRFMKETENLSIDELANSLSQDIYGNDIFVQTPMGKVIYLPSDSTPIDFAYQIHSEVGNKCVGAKVNGRIVPTNSILHNGDVVEILTNPKSKGPSRDWLKICKTSEAKKQINIFFKKNMKEENVHLGKTMLENAIKEKGYSAIKLLNKQNLEQVLAQYNLNENEFFANIGTNALPVKTIANKLASLYQKQIKLTEQEKAPASHVNFVAPIEKQVKIKGLNNILTRFANCCHPMYGDEIIGFVSAGRGIIIHRKVCPNISFYNEDRLIEVGWKPIEATKPNKKTSKNQ